MSQPIRPVCLPPAWPIRPPKPLPTSRSRPGAIPPSATNSDPKAGNGRKELEEKAKTAEEERDLSTAKYHHYELASAAFQIGIVLASAAVITGMVVLAWFAGALGVVGAGIAGAGSIRAACGAVYRVVVSNVIARSVSDEAIQN